MNDVLASVLGFIAGSVTGGVIIALVTRRIIRKGINW